MAGGAGGFATAASIAGMYPRSSVTKSTPVSAMAAMAAAVLYRGLVAATVTTTAATPASASQRSAAASSTTAAGFGEARKTGSSARAAPNRDQSTWSATHNPVAAATAHVAPTAIR